MPQKVDFEMKYIGWNIGSTRVERDQKSCGIEILEMKINGINVLDRLSDILKADPSSGESQQ